MRTKSESEGARGRRSPNECERERAVVGQRSFALRRFQFLKRKRLRISFHFSRLSISFLCLSPHRQTMLGRLVLSAGRKGTRAALASAAAASAAASRNSASPLLINAASSTAAAAAPMPSVSATALARCCSSSHLSRFSSSARASGQHGRSSSSSDDDEGGQRTKESRPKVHEN